MKEFLKDFTEDEQKDFIDRIDWDKLSTELYVRISNSPRIKIKYQIKKSYSGEPYIDFVEMPNLISRSGVCQVGLKSIYPVAFNSNLFICDGYLGFHIRMQLKIEHKDGGYNYIEILSGSYTNTNGWKFSDRP